MGHGLQAGRIAPIVPFVAPCAGLLRFGWFGFNSGSELAADVAALALLNTVAASAADLASWLIVERLSTGDPTLLVAQVLGIVVTIVIVLILDLVLVLVVNALRGGSLRVDEADEALGLDISEHGESAYPAFTGLD